MFEISVVEFVIGCLGIIALTLSAIYLWVLIKYAKNIKK